MNKFKEKPRLTLFMLMSVDGKISTGNIDARDFDKDLLAINGVKEGLLQYYAIEKTTDIYSLNTGRVMAKIGVNSRKENPKKIGCSFIIIDNKPHLNLRGVEYLLKWTKQLFLVTTNPNHPVLTIKGRENLEIIKFKNKIDFSGLFRELKTKHKVNRITVQSGGDMNASLIRQGLMDHISIVIAPCIVGGKETSTLVDGESLRQDKDLKNIKALKLVKCEKLKNSYVHLKYDVFNEM